VQMPSYTRYIKLQYIPECKANPNFSNDKIKTRHFLTKLNMSISSDVCKQKEVN
jgi:hypothetical protein